MNKAELAARLAEAVHIPRNAAEHWIAAFEEIVMQALHDGDEVTIAGFGTFSTRIRTARSGVNPRNPTTRIPVPAMRVAKFKPGQALKRALRDDHDTMSS